VFNADFKRELSYRHRGIRFQYKSTAAGIGSIILD
jgi:hypothetical protein